MRHLKTLCGTARKASRHVCLAPCFPHGCSKAADWFEKSSFPTTALISRRFSSSHALKKHTSSKPCQFDTRSHGLHHSAGLQFPIGRISQHLSTVNHKAMVINVARIACVLRGHQLTKLLITCDVSKQICRHQGFPKFEQLSIIFCVAFRRTVRSGAFRFGDIGDVVLPLM